MDEMVKHRLVPDIDHPPPFKAHRKACAPNAPSATARKHSAAAIRKSEMDIQLLCHFERGRGISILFGFCRFEGIRAKVWNLQVTSSGELPNLQRFFRSLRLIAGFPELF